MKCAHTRTCLSLLFALSGCASFNKAELQASRGAPVSAQVERLEIPHDPRYANFALVVEPVTIIDAVNRTFIDTVGVQRRAGSSNRSATTTSHVDSNERRGSRAQAKRDEGTKEVGFFSDGPSAAGQFDQETTDTKNRLARQIETTDESQNTDRHQIGSESNKMKDSFSTTSNREEHTSISHYVERLAPNGKQIEAQLITALSGVGNFKVLTPDAVSKVGHGRYKMHTTLKAQGPIVVKAQITEYGAEVAGTHNRVNLAVFDFSKSEAEGVVGLDVQLIDGRDGSIISSFPVHGTFQSREVKNKYGVIFGTRNRQFAQSLMDQALRVALNNAAQEAAVKLLK